MTQFRTRWQPLLAPIVNRTAELEALSLAWRRAAAGQGQIITLSAQAGLGKSRLINELRRQIGPARHLWLEAGGAQFFQNTPFHPAAQLIRQAFDPTGRRQHADVLVRLQTSLQEAGIQAPDAVALVTELMNLGAAGALTIPPEERRSQLFSIVFDWVLGMARSRPLAIVVEDMHWVDPSTLELIEFIVPRIKDQPVLMLLSARPDFRPPWPERGHVMRLPVQRLTDAQLHEIVTQVHRTRLRTNKGTDASGLTQQGIAAIVQRAEGVPLFGIELARLVEEPKARSSDRQISAHAGGFAGGSAGSGGARSEGGCPGCRGVRQFDPAAGAGSDHGVAAGSSAAPADDAEAQGGDAGGRDRRKPGVSFHPFVAAGCGV